jgi:N-acetylglucosamine-1-phosphodiester alpha-N-acetylglucosaminidase
VCTLCEQNAGFFAFPPHAACEGNLVLASAVKQFTSNVNVNIATNATHTMVGYSSSATVASVAPSSLVSGLFWLVRDGAPYIEKSREFPATGKAPTFVTERAPRTGSGVRADGMGMTLAVDGIEGSSLGADLYEFADLFIELGAVLAMNNDGGGSTTTVLHGKVFNTPHCSDSRTVCERDVTSITCVRD